MPTLPSGLRLGLSREALFDPGVNWFECPSGHFWYWTPDPETGLGPFPSGHEVMQVPRHAAVPENPDEAMQYIRVIVFDSETTYYWPGEWLSSFPTFLALNAADLAAWQAWVATPGRVKFLEDTIAECRVLAVKSQQAQGYAILHGRGDPREDGAVEANWKPSERFPQPR